MGELIIEPTNRVLHYYVPLSKDEELCYNLGLSKPLTDREKEELEIFFKENPSQKVYQEEPQLKGDNVIEFGPKPGRETSFSSEAVDLLRDNGFTAIERVEVSRRVLRPVNVREGKFLAEKKFDRMLQAVYPTPLKTFDVPEAIDQLITIPVRGDDLSLIRAANAKYKVGMSEAQIRHFYSLFSHRLLREPTKEEIYAIKELACSDHSVHLTFNSPVEIDGQMKEFTLMQLIKMPY